MTGTARASSDDLDFARRFEAGDVTPEDFDHRAHLRLAFVYLTGTDERQAIHQMRRAIRRLLERNNIGPDKYHETVTVAWIRAVRHFMVLAGPVSSFDAFVDNDDRLLDPAIMLTHYSEAVLFSERARNEFVAPDVEEIPRHQ